ncbi:MAG: hypothetical protein ACM3NQ_03110 [Bacteroidales bacterium]
MKAGSEPAAVRPTPKEILNAARTREQRLSRLLVLHIATGLAFMLLPGTFLGVWNLIAISSFSSRCPTKTRRPLDVSGVPLRACLAAGGGAAPA